MDRYEQALREAGQLVFFGFDGPALNEHARSAIRELHIGNVILFTRNYRSPAQFFTLIRQLQALALEANGAPMFVAADQEGGSVTRMTSGVTWFPGPMATRAAGGGPALAQAVGEGIGAEMARMGLNFVLAPVTDLADNPDSAHIGSRSYGADPQAAAPYVEAFLRGVQRHVIATAKHFPSIGGSAADLHLELGCSRRTRAQLEAFEMQPVRLAVRAGAQAVMTSHEVYAAVDDGPGTLSAALLQGYLRGRFGFEGLIVSDCMEMQALQRRVDAPQACVRAVLAGVDLLLICHTQRLQAECVHALARAICDGVIPRARLEESLARIAAKKRALPQPHTCPQPQTDALFAEDRALSRDICRRALTAKGEAALLRCGENERFLLLAPPPAALTMADETQGVHSLCAAVQRAFLQAECVEYAFPLSEQELAQLRARIARGGYSKILVATYNLHADSRQQMLLRAALSADAPVCAIALRTPYDARWYEGCRAWMLAYEYTPPMTQAVVAALRGEISCTGALPDDAARVLQRERRDLSCPKR